MTASAANDGTAVTASNDDAATEISFALHPSGSPLPGPDGLSPVTASLVQALAEAARTW